jgi:hypothetical protein
VFAMLRSPPSTNSSQLALGGSSGPAVPLFTHEHIEWVHFESKGKLGRFTVVLLFGSSGTRTWEFQMPYSNPDNSGSTVHPRTGQYKQITGGGGHFPAGGHQAGWYARVFGTVSRPGGAKQRVLITLKGRSNGTFVLTPLEPGLLKRDSGTQQSYETG